MSEKQPTCFLCGEPLEVLADKRNKPYLECAGCGIQIFIRRLSAVRRFNAEYGYAFETGGSAATRKAPTAAGAAATTTEDTTDAKQATKQPPAGAPRKRGGVLGG